MRPTRKGVGNFGAVLRADGAFIASRCEERFNAETTLDFLRSLRDHAPNGKRKVVIIFNDRFHHATTFQDWLQEVEGGIILLILPPYLSELNPFKRMRKLARRLHTHDRTFVDIVELIGRLDQQFKD